MPENPIYLREQEKTSAFKNTVEGTNSRVLQNNKILHKWGAVRKRSGTLRVHFFWPLALCLRDLRPNWAAHGSAMWVTENSTAENKTCCCNDGGGNARTYWQEDMIQWLGLFFFFPPLLNKHQTAIRLAWQYHLDFDNHRFPAAYPPFTKDIFTIILPREKKQTACFKLANFNRF